MIGTPACHYETGLWGTDYQVYTALSWVVHTGLHAVVGGIGVPSREGGMSHKPVAVDCTDPEFDPEFEQGFFEDPGTLAPECLFLAGLWGLCFSLSLQSSCQRSASMEHQPSKSFH